MSIKQPSNPSSAQREIPTVTDELTASELEAASGGDAACLSPDSLLAFCPSTLQGLDNQIKQGLNGQNGQSAQGHDRMTPFARIKG
jgi:hypothetical protein